MLNFFGYLHTFTEFDIKTRAFVTMSDNRGK